MKEILLTQKRDSIPCVIKFPQTIKFQQIQIHRILLK